MRWTVLLTLTLFGHHLHAAVIGYEFSYNFESGGVLSSNLPGEPQGDGDTVRIDSLISASYDGLLLGTDSIIYREADTVSLSGSYMHMHFGELKSWNPSGNTGYANGWGFHSTDSPGDDLAGDYIQPPLSQQFPELLDFKSYSAEAWSISPAEVPMPAAAWLLFTAIAGLGVIKRT